MQLGGEFSIFQDRNDISWGEQWKQRIEGTIDATTFLIPIITPSFFSSPLVFLKAQHAGAKWSVFWSGKIAWNVSILSCLYIMLIALCSATKCCAMAIKSRGSSLLANMPTGESFALSHSRIHQWAKCWPDWPPRLSGRSIPRHQNPPPAMRPHHTTSLKARRTNLTTKANSNKSLLLRRRFSEQVRAKMNLQPLLWTHFTGAIIPA